jgi:uncharacterized OsmC-like protein
MRITLHGESDLTVSHLHEPDQEIDVDEGVHAHYSAMQMFGVSLGLCTMSVLASYADQLEIGIQNMKARVKWDYVEDPYRIGSIDMEVTWPEVPESRLRAVERAAGQCTIHNTLHHPPEMSTTVTKG